MSAATPSGCDLLPAETLRTFLQSAERCGYDAAPLVKGLQSEPRALISTRAMVPWADLVTLANQVVAQRGQLELDRITRDFTVALPSLRLLGSMLLPPRAFYRVLCQTWARPCFWAVQIQEEGPRMTVHLELRRSLEGCAPLLASLATLLGTAPRLLNLPDLPVEVRVQSPHTARYSFTLPQGRGFHVRLGESRLAALVHQLADKHRHEKADSMPSVATLESRFGLTRAEGRVVRRLGAGRSLTEIAQELGVGTETIRTHAKRAMHKTDTHRQAELVALVLRIGAGHSPQGE